MRTSESCKQFVNPYFIRCVLGSARTGLCGGPLQILDLNTTIPWQLPTSIGSGSISVSELEEGTERTDSVPE
jgi:hypothetical protein